MEFTFIEAKKVFLQVLKFLLNLCQACQSCQRDLQPLWVSEEEHVDVGQEAGYQTHQDCHGGKQRLLFRLKVSQ